jgi:hypothetical protein
VRGVLLSAGGNTQHGGIGLLYLAVYPSVVGLFSGFFTNVLSAPVNRIDAPGQ